MKIKLAEKLHDKVLYADADMNKADWMTASAAAVGVLGIGVGLWWADCAAALLISISILRDGIKNLRGAVGALIDTRAHTVDDSAPDPLNRRIDTYLKGLPWCVRRLHASAMRGTSSASSPSWCRPTAPIHHWRLSRKRGKNAQRWTGR